LNHPARRAALMRGATYAALAVAGLLIVIKTYAWLLSDSVAMLSSLVDSILDALASVINFVAVRHALTPADREHRFGHGKAEALAGLGQAAFIGGSAVFLLFQAGHRLIRPQPVDNGALAITVLVLSIMLTLALVLFQRYVVRQTGSLAISADQLHYKTDLLVNLGIIAGLAAVMGLGWHFVDPLVAAVVAGYILWSAFSIVRDSFDHLMDREFSDAERERVAAIAKTHAEVRDVHDLRTRSSGVQQFIQLHLELDGDLTLIQAHDIADEVEILIADAFPGAEVIIHQDPAGLDEDHPTFG
jgi:ferrous-iron efflux pump FieF